VSGTGTAAGTAGVVGTEPVPAAAGPLTVWDGVPEWWEQLAHGAPLLGSRPWLVAMSGRLGRRALTFAVPAAGSGPGGPPAAALYATLQAEPRPGEHYDLHHLVMTATHTLPLTEAARAARAEIEAAAPGPERWTPSVVVMYPGYECFPVGPGGTDPATLDTLVGGIVAWARSAGARTVGFPYLRPAAAPLADALHRHGFTAVPLTYSFDLPVTGPDFTGYLRALPKKRRVEVGRELRQLAEAGIDLRQPPVADVFDELVRLRCALVRKYRGAVDVDNERAKVRRIVDDVAGGAPRVFCAMAGDAVLSAALFAGTDRDWTCLVSGTDYADPRSRFCYFATAYYEPVRAAAPLGVRLLRYGQGAWHAKLARGCQPTPMTGWVLPLDPALAAGIRRSAELTEVTLSP
jgi:hypothetical protein